MAAASSLYLNGASSVACQVLRLQGEQRSDGDGWSALLYCAKSGKQRPSFLRRVTVSDYQTDSNRIRGFTYESVKHAHLYVCSIRSVRYVAG